jgi:hypothetical protein
MLLTLDFSHSKEILLNYMLEAADCNLALDHVDTHRMGFDLQVGIDQLVLVGIAQFG